MDPLSPRSPHKARSARHESSPKSPRFKLFHAVAGLPSPPQSPLTDEFLMSPTALPPLVLSNSTPSRQTLRPPTLPLHLDHDYPVVHLDNWPLTTSTTLNWNGRLPLSPRQEDRDSSLTQQSTSPLSPRAIKSNARHKLFEETKSKPLLLRELYAFAKSELEAINVPRTSENDLDLSASTPPNLQRLQIFRELFSRVIESFSVYAPLLAQIKDEYEAAIRHLLAKCQLIPQLHSELQSLEAQCLQELSQHQIETKLKHKALKQMLKETQAKLAACAAENAHLKDENDRVNEQLKCLEKRYEEMHISNHSLVNGIKRQDDTIRHIHDRSREEGMVLQQMTLKYHRACDEIAELKKTVAALEEKVGGVHVAADKATIALLTKDLQELHSKLHSASPNPPIESDNESLTHDQVLHRVLWAILERNGVTSTEIQLLEMIKTQSFGSNVPSPLVQAPLVRVTSTLALTSSMTSLPSTATTTKPKIPPSPLTGILLTDLLFGIDRVATLLTDQISLFHIQTNQRAHRTSQQKETSTFLTEPDERVSFTTVGGHLLAPLVCTTDLIPTRGMSSDVPEYLQYEGVVRNFYYDRKRVELLIAKVWAYKDDLDGKAKRQNTHPVVPSVRLAQAFTLYLHRCFPSNRHDQIECAYNVVTAVDRFARGSSDCRLFKLILEAQLPDEARLDQAKELTALHDVLASMHRELKTHATRIGVTGLPLADVVCALRRQFPWKSDVQLSRLHRALLVDLHGHSLVDFASLFQQSDDGNSRHLHAKPRVKSQFVECLRAQYIDDSLAFRQYLQSQVTKECMTSENGTPGMEENNATATNSMVAIRVLRDCLQRCDQAKPVQEINRLLTVATGLSMDQILTHDAMMVSATQFVATLPTVLVKPSGKFGEPLLGVTLTS